MDLFPRIRQVHFVGIGGIGMSGIAEVLLTLGYRVTGSDLAVNAMCRRLTGLGAHIDVGHAAAQVEGAHVVVISSAVKGDNPEVRAAQKRGIPVIPRAEMLAELMRMKHGLAVAGTHGKTTTTSMLASVMTGAGQDPTVVIGGRLNALGGTNAKLGRGRYLVAEADESDGSFLKLTPTIGVITNIAREHLDHYADLEAIKAAFIAFANRVPFYGAAVVCLDDPHVRRIIPAIHRAVITYGLSLQADVRADGLEFSGFTSRFNVWHREECLGEVRLQMPGRHNVLNALAVVAVCLELELSFDIIAEGLAAFSGVQRRFQHKGEVAGVWVVDDYAHHPEEITETLAAARAGFPEKRLVVVFQPHRYTRTRDQLEDFMGAFHNAHEVLLTDIYGAGERPIEGVSAAVLAAGIRDAGHRHVHHVGTQAGVLDVLGTLVKPGDILLTLGAGDIWKVGESFLTARGGEVKGAQG